MRRRMIGRGFEGFDLPPAAGLRRVPAFEDFQINQAGRLPRRGVVEAIPPVDPGPAVIGAGFDRDRVTSMLDNPGVANVGRQITVGSGSQRSASILEARCSDQRSRQLTIFLSVEEFEAANDRDLVCLLSWGAGGLQVSNVEVDFVNGASFSIVATFMRLWVRNDSSLPSNNFRVGAFVGYEPRPAGSAIRGPQRTLKTATIAAGATVDLTIPRFATSFSYIRNPLTSAITINVLDGGGNVIGIIPLAAGADLSQNVYPIPGDAATLRVGAAAADQVAGRAIFGLCL